MRLWVRPMTTTSNSEPREPTIVIDTREQEPYSFDTWRVNSVRKALPAGDYSLAGYEETLAVERKSLDDLVSTVIWGRKRFLRELAKLAEYEAACIVVEAHMEDIVRGKYRSHATPHSVLGSLVSIHVDYGIPVFCCSNRQIACYYVAMFLLRYHRKVSAEKCQPITRNKENESAYEDGSPSCSTQEPDSRPDG